MNEESGEARGAGELMATSKDAMCEMIKFIPLLVLCLLRRELVLRISECIKLDAGRFRNG